MASRVKHLNCRFCEKQATHRVNDLLWAPTCDEHWNEVKAVVKAWENQKAQEWLEANPRG